MATEASAHSVVTSIFCRNIAILYNDPGVLNLYDMIRAREKMEYRVAEEAIPGGMNYPNGANYNSADKMLKDAEQDPNKFRLINSSTSHGISVMYQIWCCNKNNI